MARREPSLSQLGARVRDAHLEVANASDWQRARERFNDAVLGQLGHEQPTAKPRRGWLLLLAATLSVGVAAAAVISAQKPPGAPPARPTPAAATSVARPQPQPAAAETLPAPEPSAPASAPLGAVRKPMGTAAVSSEPPLSALSPTQQREKLLAERRSAASSAAASSAAFRLGRLEADYLGNPGAAAKWFAIYLAEQPQGPLRGDARGRLFECLWHSGQKAAAAAEAQRYLLDYPGGPYAARARHILNP